ncbi:hypothetical protein RUM44_003309 [Polyplax serrata]|uniref:Nardilysin n=1 Tax=Polyplax serrata TaxID=468196 RepID=A0ABR1AG35_POLSC
MTSTAQSMAMLSQSQSFEMEGNNSNGEIDQTLIKSQNDTMEYRLITLKNGLKAILVSDVTNIVNLNEKTTELNECDTSESSEDEACQETASEDEDVKVKSKANEAEEKFAACSLSIGVGSFSDPPDIPGLAHFLEHMVFMGSEKYPQENGFDEFIKKNGGSDNGSTECETTTFYLECSEKYLREGMDRFAQFFISPLMIADAMAREKEIVHSEFEMSLPSDGTRREQILGSLAPPNHPAAKFHWGNLTTLRTNIDDKELHNRVHDFQKRHYSAHRMTLAVQARLSLNTLEEYVRESFSDIPSNDLPPENFTNHIGTFGNSDNFNKIIWIKPVKDICEVHLTWILPSYMKEYKSRPLNYVGWLIGHEGEGSLLSVLRKKVWALECEAGNDQSGFEHNSIYSIFSISLTLTEEGFESINEVIKLVFSYISMLKKNCPNKIIYDELKTVCETNFRYRAEIPSASYVEILSESMHVYEPPHYIAGRMLYLEYKPELITEIISYLRPDNANVIIYSTEKQNNFYNAVEPWFQTKFKIEDIPFEWMEQWVNSVSCGEFHIPHPNPYLTTNFSLLPKPQNNPLYPTKILDNNLMEIWYRQDVKFLQPLAYYAFYVISPLLKSDALNAVLLDVLTAYLEEKFKEQIYVAKQAGLHCTYWAADLGLFLQFMGYNEKLPLLFDEILKLIQKCCSEINDESNIGLFNAIKKERSRCYYNKFLKPKKLVKMTRLSILVDNYYTSVEYLARMGDVTLASLHEFSQKFFKNVRIQGLIQGNVSVPMSIEICEKFRTILGCSPLEGKTPKVMVTKLDVGEQFLRLKSFNEADSNSVITNYYQAGPGNIRTACIIDLLMMMMDEPLFDNLRTKQQIGYDVHCLQRDTFGILGFSITVFFQSSKFTADEVDKRIETFICDFLQNLKSMSEKDWEEIKTSLCLLKNSADLQLLDEVKRNFEEICSNEYKFDRLKKEIEIIPTITPKEVCDWFEDHIATGGKFKKLSIQVLGNPSNLSQSPSAERNLGDG